MDSLYEFARGPLFSATILFMVLGLARHAILRTRDIVRVMRRTPKRDVPWRQVAASSAAWIVPVKAVVRQVPLLSLASVVMHVGLVLVPLFLAAHNRLWERTVGFALPSMSVAIADILTLATLAAGLTLLLVRVLRKAARDLSRLWDYVLLVIVLTPFASGYLAVHPESAPLSWDALMLVHVLSADLLFVLVPTTKLAHVVLFPFDRLSGDIFWRLVPGAGDRVARALRGDPQGAEA